LTVEQFILCIL